MNDTPKTQKKTISRRSAARIAAVQALYEMDITDADPGVVLDVFLKRHWPQGETEDGSPPPIPEPEPTLLSDLVRGVTGRLDDLNAMINGALTNEWTVDRLEVLLRSILRAGTYELIARADVDARTVISEYVDMAHAFYEGPEPGMVNGVLDRLARTVRERELTGNGDDQGAASK